MCICDTLCVACAQAGWSTAQTMLRGDNVLGFLRMLRMLPNDVLQQRIRPADVGVAKDRLVAVSAPEVASECSAAGDVLMWAMGLVQMFEVCTSLPPSLYVALCFAICD